MLLAILGVVFGLPFGLPGMVLGPVGYFMGRRAEARIATSGGAIAGHSQAQAGRVLGVIATAIGCVTSLIWLVLFFLAISATSQ